MSGAHAEKPDTATVDGEAPARAVEPRGDDFDGESGESTRRRPARRRTRSQVPRPRSVFVRLSEDEHAAVVAAASRVGLTTSGYVAEVAVRTAVGTTPPAPSAVREAMGDLVRNQATLSRVGNNLNQVAAAYNATGELPPEVRDVLALVGRVLTSNSAALDELRRRLP